jgi:hypothetical protein
MTIIRKSAFTEVGLTDKDQHGSSNSFNIEGLTKVSWLKKQLMLAFLIINIIFAFMLLILC